MADSKAKQILLESKVSQAELNAKAKKIREGAKLKYKQELELKRLEFEDKLLKEELHKSKSLAEIESLKMKEMMAVMDPETLKKMAEAGPKYQAELLKGLGLSGFIMTDGNNPINLFNTASGLIGGKQEGQ